METIDYELGAMEDGVSDHAPLRASFTTVEILDGAD